MYVISTGRFAAGVGPKHNRQVKQQVQSPFLSHCFIIKIVVDRSYTGRKNQPLTSSGFSGRMTSKFSTLYLDKQSAVRELIHVSNTKGKSVI